jgi:hypothetical protein
MYAKNEINISIHCHLLGYFESEQDEKLVKKTKEDSGRKDLL